MQAWRERWANVRALLMACHPLPAAAVTTLTTVLAAAAGVGGPLLWLLAAAVLSGQLCVGWVNDFLDRDRDRAVGRHDKPLATGVLRPRTVARAAAAAGAACLPLSLSLGVAAGVCHLVAVVAALGYDLGLKRTVWSWLPYAVAFGLLPVVVWLVSPDGGLPPAWLVAAGSLLGVGAHGANVLPDYERDRSTEVMGLPQRLGLPMLRLATAGALLAALALLTFGPPGSPQAWDWAAFGVGCVLTLVAAAGSFPAVIAIAALAVAVLVVRGMVG
ncbi:MAG TPA: UbiA family prenyltransferase [Jiangellaceae bacterium]|nr:UbiA family prenyltransferase [Jiangellaceae bacterium]